MGNTKSTQPKWYMPVLLGGLITVSIALVGFAYASITKNAEKKSIDAVNVEKSHAIDSLQWVAINANNESNGNTNKRVDRVVDEQNTVNTAILEALQSIQEGQNNQTKVLKKLCQKVDGMKDYIEFLPEQRAYNPVMNESTPLNN